VNDTQKAIINMLESLAIFYNLRLNDTVIEIFMACLQELTSQEVKVGFEKYMKSADSKFFPRPGQIYELARPKLSARAQASLVADTIFALINGPYDATGTEKARQKIGEVGWIWVKQMGGWQVLCQSITCFSQVPIMKAQCRDAIAALIENSNCGTSLIAPFAIESTQPRSLEDFGVKLNSIEKIEHSEYEI
jgi:hypothetical protein